jgi:hypothetical protein
MTYSAFSRFRNFQILANLSRQKVVDFSVARNGCDFSRNLTNHWTRGTAATLIKISLRAPRLRQLNR